MKNPPGLYLSDDTIHHRPQTIEHPIIRILLPKQPQDYYLSYLELCLSNPR